MAAVIKVYEMSASLAGADKTSGTVRFKLADNSTVDTSNPIVIPADGSAYSFSKHLRLYCATAPDTQVDNLKAYPDAANNFGTGVSVVAENVGNTYTTNATTPVVASDLWVYSSVSPIDMDSTDASALVATGFGGDMLRLQMVVASTASPGALSTETLTWAYDEI